MINTPTPHNEAKKGEIAKTVIMPGDPLRAQFIAENYLENIKPVNSVRNMLAFTGTYKGKKITIMGSGMGMPSMGIYSYELFDGYDVEQIIRVGSAGAIDENLHVKDIVIAMGACTDSNFAVGFHLPGSFAPIADYSLLQKAVKACEDLNYNCHVGNIVSSDHFYTEGTDGTRQWQKMGVLAVEMEAAALYMNAARLGKKALAIMTISDCIFTNEELSSDERLKGFRQMMEVALEAAIAE